MRSVERSLLLAAALAAAAGCGGGSGGGRGSVTLPVTGRNAVAVSVDGSLCGTNAGTYVNEPCVSVTVCTPGTQTCQTISDVLLDTGSFGLRVFKQVLGVSLTPVSSGAGALAECVTYGDLSSDWGPVEIASVILGGEPAVQVPIQVIDSTYSVRPASCTNPETDPTSAGFNGILGVGAFLQDCGGACATSVIPNTYYSCGGGSCAGVAVPLAQQVANPVAALPQDANGIAVVLPAVGASGAPSADGTLLLGVGTAQNNVPGSVAVLDLDGFGEFQTTLSGSTLPAFADTGSNALFFDPPAGVTIPTCGSSPPSSDFFCPNPAVNLVATNNGATRHAGASTTFQIADFLQLPTSTNAVFSNLGGPGLGSGSFDWGLPFFLGRTVFIGFEGRTSPLGAGPCVAY